MEPVKVVLTKHYGVWIANLYGGTASILRRSPGNKYPAQRAQWNTREEAERELPAILGAPVEIVHVREIK